jgi:hypothetical protein
MSEPEPDEPKRLLKPQEAAQEINRILKLMKDLADQEKERHTCYGIYLIALLGMARFVVESTFEETAPPPAVKSLIKAIDTVVESMWPPSCHVETSNATKLEPVTTTTTSLVQ